MNSHRNASEMKDYMINSVINDIYINIKKMAQWGNRHHTHKLQDYSIIEDVQKYFEGQGYVFEVNKEEYSAEIISITIKW